MSIANPFRTTGERDAWGSVGLDKLFFPGIVRSVDGVERPIEWVTQNGIGLTGAARIFKQRKLVEGSKIECAITDADQWDYWLVVHNYINVPKGVRPKTYKIRHPAFDALEIKLIEFDSIPTPVYRGKGLYTVTYTISEYAKGVPVPTGQADPAKVDGPPKPADEFESMLKGVLDQVTKATGGP